VSLARRADVEDPVFLRERSEDVEGPVERLAGSADDGDEGSRAGALRAPADGGIEISRALRGEPLLVLGVAAVVGVAGLDDEALREAGGNAVTAKEDGFDLMDGHRDEDGVRCARGVARGRRQRHGWGELVLGGEFPGGARRIDRSQNALAVEVEGHRAPHLAESDSCHTPRAHDTAPPGASSESGVRLEGSHRRDRVFATMVAASA